MILAQKRPGEWAIFSDYAPPIPVPAWLVEQTSPEYREILMRELAVIFGNGRRLGKIEGANKIRKQITQLLQVEEVPK